MIIIINGDQVIAGKNGSALVSSRSQPGGWHIVRDGQCDCIGFEKRGRCRHVVGVAQLAGQPAPVENPTFALVERTLAGEFDGGRKVREEFDYAVITAGEDISFAEWKERRAS